MQKAPFDDLGIPSPIGIETMDVGAWRSFVLGVIRQGLVAITALERTAQMQQSTIAALLDGIKANTQTIKDTQKANEASTQVKIALIGTSGTTIVAVTALILKALNLL
ncbi:hypothetical protein KKF82_06725 [Patescibacteria group bacterium]|uniref:Uncharacterized protein n=1 Tax=viral metagenome TaxID=1070528 RepID=A0A6M3X4F9_9ZZZZ|nr:hypothetical protein [Patescibacteria group bacterium]